MVDFKFDGPEAKVGTFTYKDVTLYEGDAFKVLYANGEWAWPSESGWGADVMAQFSNLATNADGYFVNGGLGNESGTGRLRLHAYGNGDGDDAFLRADLEGR